MTDTTNNNELPGQQPAPELPGRKLRAAREARGLTREEVAAQLRLQLRQITALEEDDYDALPGQTFVSGYLRSYARLLGLPESAFVTPVKPTSEPPTLVSAAASRKEASSRDWLTRLATVVIIGMIGVSVVMWWQGEHRPPAPQATAPAAALPTPEPEQSLALPEAAPQPAAEAAPAPTEIPAGETAAQVSEPAQAGQPETTPEAAVPSVEEEAAKPAPPPLTEDMPQSKLELHYQADSWTEVNDSAGRELAYNLIKAGEVLVLRGEAPFRVFLGYAPGVIVYYNGELFDHSPFQRRDVARFRVGRAEHNHPGSR